MHTDDLARIDRIVESALALPRSHRAAYIAVQDGDGSVLREVQAIVDAFERADTDVDDAVVADVLQPGVVLAGLYTIERQLGEGGFGAVFMCRDSDGRCAVKTVLRRKLDEPQSLALFQREVVRWIRLGRHPNIVYAYGQFEFMRLPFVIMEYIDGAVSLEREIADGRFGWRNAVIYGEQIANALAYAQQTLGLVHNDLKPDNILIAPSGVAKVLDFGLSVARSFEADELAGGTPAYVAPERWLGQPDHGERSDIYSFGILLFEITTGRQPFPKRTTMHDYARDHIDTPAPSPRDFADAPKPLAFLIARCLRKDPADRPATFAELARELRDIRSDLIPGFDMERARDAAPIRLPTHIEALINEAISYNWMGMGAEARAAAEKALALDPASVNAWITLGNAFRNEGRFDEARRATERAYALDPSSEISMVNLAHLSSKLGDTDAVRKWIGIALEHARRSDRFAFLEGMLYELVELGRLDEAVDYADLVLRENPFAVMALNTRAIALRRLRRLSEALQTIERALELNPAYAKGWSNRATIELELEQFAQAIASADRALSFDASLGGPYLAKASASLMLGRLDEAIATLSAGAQARPGDRRLSEALAQYRAITTEELDGLRSLQR